MSCKKVKKKKIKQAFMTIEQKREEARWYIKRYLELQDIRK